MKNQKPTFKILLFSLLILFTLQVKAESRKEFIRKYKNIAISEMERTGIPASIKLAQGILESGCGASDLSTKAHNHFGIKCHDWDGPTFHMDDDSPDECFRKYENPEQSWIDHSTFLTSRPRYAGLFEIPTTNYKAWAKGLKSAGYATNPEYAEKLIKIIEDEELYQYDRLIKNPSRKPINVEILAEKNSKPKHAIYRNREEIKNGLLCIEAQEGDTYGKIAEYYGIKLKKLLAYNDRNDSSLKPGQTIYLKNKKTKAARGYEFHRVKAGDSLYEISQRYGVKLSSLVKYNYITENSKIVEGEKVYLRAKANIF